MKKVVSQAHCYYTERETKLSITKSNVFQKFAMSNVISLKCCNKLFKREKYVVTNKCCRNNKFLKIRTIDTHEDN